MEIVVCPHCKTRVLPTAAGACPSCREPIESPEAEPEPPIEAAYADELLRPTADELVPIAEEPVDTNPYAAPRIEIYDELPEWAEWKAKAIVKETEAGWIVLLFSLMFSPALPVMGLWCMYRLTWWYALNRFVGLQLADPSSPHFELAGRFQKARPILWKGVVIGGVGVVIAMAIVCGSLLSAMLQYEREKAAAVVPAVGNIFS